MTSTAKTALASTGKRRGMISASLPQVGVARRANNSALASTEYWAFASSTAASDPGAGNVRINSATLASVTALYVDNLDADGASQTAWLATLAGHRVLVRSGKSNAFVSFLVGTVTDSTGYRTIAVTYINGAGAFVATERLAITLI